MAQLSFPLITLKVCCCYNLLRHGYVQLFASPVDCRPPGSSVGFPSQEYWGELPFPSPGDLPNLGIKLVSPALAGAFFTAEPPGKPFEIICPIKIFGASLVAQMVKNLPATWETEIQSLGWENLLEKGMATYSSILTWRIPWTEEPGKPTVHGVTKSQT